MNLIASIALTFALLAVADPASASGLTPSYGYIAPGWTPPQVQDLTAFWRAAGLQESGFTSYSVGGPPAGSPYFERFDPTGATYQDFFGTYVIDDFKYAGDWLNPDGTARTDMQPCDVTRSAEELVALAVADQEAWLAFYSGQFGGPVATALVPGTLAVLPAGGGTFLVTFALSSYSDLGAPAPPAPFVPPYGLYASLVPAWQPVTLAVAGLVHYDAPHAEMLVVYGNATGYLISGQPQVTPPATVVQIGRMAAATTFQ